VATLMATVMAPVASAAEATLERDAEVGSLIGEREVIFLARELGGERSHALSIERIDERHPPFSTFKIPNFLIALERGVIDDPEALREWIPERRPPADHWPAAWQQPQNLIGAFRRSAVWFFRDVALAVGGGHYREALKRFNYGNRAAPDGSDRFWLDGALQVSVREQVRFLAGLLSEGYGFDARHLAWLEEASLLETAGQCRLHGKTGAGPAGEDFDGPFEGWLVGWSRCAERAPTVFALWTRGESYLAIRDFRREAAVALLRRIGAFPAPPVELRAPAAQASP